MICVATIKNAETVVDLGIDTVVMTNCLFKVKVELKRIASAKVKNDEIKSLKALILAKKTVVGDDVLADRLSLGSASSSFSCWTCQRFR
jgi:hypothetical protein